MGKTWPAIDVVNGEQDLVLAAADDYSPTAVEERDDSLRIFFLTAEIRDRAATALASRFALSSVDVGDDDWARRSQQGLKPIEVGDITVVPTLLAPAALPGRHVIVIPPSMGFGTGHHATTRLCLAALQLADPRGKTVLDVGTGIRPSRDRRREARRDARDWNRRRCRTRCRRRVKISGIQ